MFKEFVPFSYFFFFKACWQSLCLKQSHGGDDLYFDYCLLIMLSTNREDAQRFMLRLRLGICMIKFFIILNFIFYINFSSVSESNDVEAWETPKSSLPSMPAPQVVSPVPSKTNASKSLLVIIPGIGCANVDRLRIVAENVCRASFFFFLL